MSARSIPGGDHDKLLQDLFGGCRAKSPKQYKGPKLLTPAITYNPNTVQIMSTEEIKQRPELIGSCGCIDAQRVGWRLALKQQGAALVGTPWTTCSNTKHLP
eukprot:1593411-Amphidinium_carterae.1